jgi:hypothetical protein
MVMGLIAEAVSTFIGGQLNPARVAHWDAAASSVV